MFDIKLIRDNKEAVQKGLAAKNVTADLDSVLKYEQKRKDLLADLEELRSKKNAANDEIGRLIKEKKDPKKKIASMKDIASKIDKLEPEVKKVQTQLAHVLDRVGGQIHPLTDPCPGVQLILSRA